MHIFLFIKIPTYTLWDWLKRCTPSGTSESPICLVAAAFRVMLIHTCHQEMRSW